MNIRSKARTTYRIMQEEDKPVTTAIRTLYVVSVGTGMALYKPVRYLADLIADYVVTCYYEVAYRFYVQKSMNDFEVNPENEAERL